MTDGFPQTLVECIEQFSDADRANEFMTRMRWPQGVQCPRCQSKNLREIKTRRLWVCKDCAGHNQFSVKVGSIFEDSPIKMGKWLTAIWLILNAKNGISSHELGRSIGVTQKSAWFMLHRIRTAVETGSFQRMHGTVEADETFVGGSADFMHKKVKKAKGIGRGYTTKTAVMALLEHAVEKGKSRVRAKVIKNTKKQALKAVIDEAVETGSTLHTDAWIAYQSLGADYIHKFVDHAVEYVRDGVSTNGLENFFCLLKRTLRGTYVHVNAEHLFRYLNEQVFRFNARKGNDAARFAEVLGQVAGRRLTHKQLIGVA